MACVVKITRLKISDLLLLCSPDWAQKGELKVLPIYVVYTQVILSNGKPANYWPTRPLNVISFLPPADLICILFVKHNSVHDTTLNVLPLSGNWCLARRSAWSSACMTICWTKQNRLFSTGLQNGPVKLLAQVRRFTIKTPQAFLNRWSKLLYFLSL